MIFVAGTSCQAPSAQQVWANSPRLVCRLTPLTTGQVAHDRAIRIDEDEAAGLARLGGRRWGLSAR